MPGVALKLILSATFATVFLLATGADSLAAGSKVVHWKRSQFTSAQRDKFMEQARQACRKKYGAGATVYRLEYSPLRLICQEG